MILPGMQASGSSRARLSPDAPRRASLLRHLSPALLVVLSGCGGDSTGPPPVNYDEIDPIVYSEHVQPILDLSCNTAACHNRQDRALGLSLASYEDLAAGSRFGAMVIPFKSNLSHFYLHVTGAIEPRMPLSLNPLGDDVVRFLKRWIDTGAAKDDGRPMHSDVMRKVFVACQGENSVAVLDLDTGLLLRVLDVDQPHSVYVHERTRSLYVSRFETASDNLQVYDADTYELISARRAGTFPALMMITPDDTQLWVTNFDTASGARDHRVRVYEPTTLAEIISFEIPGVEQPHGIAISQEADPVYGYLVYVTGILSDNVTIFRTRPEPDVVEVVPLPDVGSSEVQQPQQCILSNDGSRLFVSALGSDRVHVLDTSTLHWISEVPVGDGPWHLTLSPGGGEIWVANWLGESISIIDVASLASTTLSSPHPLDPDRKAIVRPIGIAFSPEGSRVFVANANDNDQGNGHHPPPGGEKNPGSVAIFDAASRTATQVTEVPYFSRFLSFLP